MSTWGAVIAVWLGFNLLIVVASAAASAWRTHSSRQRARRHLREDRLREMDPLEQIALLPTFDPHVHQ